MLDIIKKASLGAVTNANPVIIMFGNITSTAPLEINIEQRLTLPEELLIIPESMSTRTWELGDHVLLLRMQGGQRFILWDRVVKDE